MSRRYLRVWVPEWLAPVLALLFDQFGTKWHQQIGLFKAPKNWREKFLKEMESGKDTTTRAFKREIARIESARRERGGGLQ